jgi:hypothetical protein
MEDTGNIPNNITYSLALLCDNNNIAYSDTNATFYSFYVWSNSTCNRLIISQTFQGNTYSESFNTLLLSNYGFQWDACLLDPTQAYTTNIIVSTLSHPNTLVAISNPYSGCYVMASDLYIYQSNYYTAYFPVENGQMYSIRVNNTFLTTIIGQSSQGISLDELLTRLEQQQNNNLINITLSGAVVNLTYINGYPELIIQTPYNVSSINVILYNNSVPISNYTLNNIYSNIANVIITNPPGFNFTENEYAVISINYINGLQEVLYYPPYKIYGTVPYIIAWIFMLALIYLWFSAYEHFWKIIIAIFALIGAMILASLFNVAGLPLLFASGFFIIYLYEFAIKFFVEKVIGDIPLFKFSSVFLKIILVLMFISTILLSLNVPTMGPSANIESGLQLAQNLQGVISGIANNPLSLPINIVLLGGYVIYGAFLSISMIGQLVATVLGLFSPVLGPFASTLSIIIQAIMYLAIAVVIIVSLWTLLFGLSGIKFI